MFVTCDNVLCKASGYMSWKVFLFPFNVLAGMLNKRKWRLLRTIPSTGSLACKLQLVPWVWGNKESQATGHDLVQTICIKKGMGTWAIVQWGEDGQSGWSPRDSCRSQWRMRRPQNKYQHWNGCIDCKGIKNQGFLFGILPWRHPPSAVIMLSTMGASCAMGNLGTSWWGKFSLNVWLWCM